MMTFKQLSDAILQLSPVEQQEIAVVQLPSSRATRLAAITGFVKTPDAQETVMTVEIVDDAFPQRR